MNEIPKYKLGDILYYISPFVFTIEKVLIEFIDINKVEPQKVYYVDSNGGYFLECNLVDNLFDAKVLANKYLNRFFVEKSHEILNSNPELNIED